MVTTSNMLLLSKFGLNMKKQLLDLKCDAIRLLPSHGVNPEDTHRFPLNQKTDKTPWISKLHPP